ncbi:mannitol dehydrogenase family protein [Apibacter muscae]|uniref:mannitol dehydrogenase family protein n=1 Tax=Apibacter muscae TaxID=2509004 RepID=UPI0011AD0B40|nr:mannitol dehydrogenase family protein [Apibacter muscae]TWP28107.1 mannitol dehydrogenase family protein [Apibacter muscae]
MEFIKSNFESSTINCGILHIGVGNFHRAHQAYYINQLLEFKDQNQWGICGVGLLPSDKKLMDALHSQNLAYTLTVCGRNGDKKVYEINSIQELIWGIENPEAVLNKIADENIQIISLTITEGGYNIDKENGNFDINEEQIKHDLENPQNPRTIFGFISEGLRRRKEKCNKGLTILSCDNLQHNGNTARKAFLTFIQAQDSELAPWVEQKVTFPNSMVDRITPITTVEDISKLNNLSGMEDKAPVYCEDFIQWVIEDNFAEGRPNLERVGVEFTQEVDIYENMKLSLLNASHTLLSYPAFLKGFRKVDEAMHDEDILEYVKEFMNEDITPYVPAPPNTNLEDYKKILIERFSNHAVSDQVSRLCADGVSKFPVYIVPNLIKMIEDRKDLKRIAFLVASYRHYLKYKVDDKGNSYEINEPWLSNEDQKNIESSNVLDFLNISPFKSCNLIEKDSFIDSYIIYAENINKNGMSIELKKLIHKQ